ncbi:MAG: hypothetical protein V8S96_02855 [Lachnospiraceae bacterium]
MWIHRSLLRNRSRGAGTGSSHCENLKTLAGLKVPVLSIVIGEGGSGGALALAQANEVWILENAVYSILSPEGFPSIVWKDSGRAAEAAGLMKLRLPESFMNRGSLTG